MNKIPKKIHYCWLSGEDFPELIKKCIDSWKRYLPDYEIIEWNTSNFDVDICQYTKEAFSAKKWAFVSDYVRLHVLYYHGGIYLDSDIEVLRSFDDLLQNKSFTGFENSQYIAAWIFGSEKGNALFKQFLRYYENRSFLNPDGSYDLTPNPVPITRECIRQGLIQNNTFQELECITIYPTEYFCPQNYMTGKIVCTKNTYAIHHFNASWHTDKEKLIQKKERRIRNFFGCEIGNRINLFLSIYRENSFKILIEKIIKALRR